MADQQLQPLQPSLVRMVGVDAPQLDFGKGASPMTEAPKVQDTAFARIQDAQKAVDSMFDIQRGNLESQANLQQSYSQAAAAKGKPQWVQDFANLGDTIMQGVKIVKAQDLAIEQAEAKRAAELAQAATIEQQKVIAEQQAKDKAAREQYEAEQKKNANSVANAATLRVEELLLNMGILIRENGEESGVIQTKRELDEYFQSIKETVDPDVYQALTQRAYAELRQVDGTLTSRSIEQGKQVRSAIADQQFAVYKNRATSIFVQLENALDPASLDAGMNSLNELFKTISQDSSLNAVERMEIQTNLLNLATDKQLTNASAQARLTQSVEANREYLDAFQKLQELKDSGQINRNQYETMLNDINLANVSRLPWLKGVQLSSTEEQQKMALDLAETNERLIAAAKKIANEEAVRQLSELDKQTVGFGAYQILQNPHRRTQIEQSGDPRALAALQIADAFQKDSDKAIQLRRQLASQNTKLAALARQLDPTRVGVQRQYDTLTGEFKEVPGIPTNSISKEEYDAAVNELFILGQEAAAIEAKWKPYGLSAINPNSREYQYSREQIEQRQQSIQSTTGIVPEAPTAPFNRATGAAPSPLTPVATLQKYQYQGRTLTIPIDPNVRGGITSGYGVRTHPIRGTKKMHWGIDIAAPAGTPIRTLAGGRVVLADQSLQTAVNPGGYGLTVVIQTPDGHYEQYSHNSANTVKVGDVVPPGAVVAKVGSTGGSTGAHTHMNVWKPGKFNPRLGATDGAVIDPVGYMARDFTSSRVPPATGAGLPAGGSTARTGALPPGLPPMLLRAFRNAGIDPNSVSLGGSTTIDPYTGVGVPTSSVTGGRAPNYARRGLSINRADYPAKNDPEANYGYSALAQDAAFRRKIAEVADRLGMPAVWLVDVMHFESANFQPGITNSIGATGLIQFMPETAIGLGTTTAQLRRMNRIQQMEYVYKYFEPIKGKIKSPGDVLAYIFGGHGLWSKPEAQRNGRGDGHITYGAYKRRLGNAVGRSYAFSI